MPGVWWSTMDFVAMNSSSGGMAYCQGNTSHIWRVSREFLVCRVVKLLLVTVSHRISPVRSGSTPTPHSFLWRACSGCKSYAPGNDAERTWSWGDMQNTHSGCPWPFIKQFFDILEIIVQLVEAKSRTMVSAFSESICCLLILQFHTLSFLSGMHAAVS